VATLREQIVAAMLSALNAGTPGGVPATERTRRLAIPESPTLSAIVLRPARMSAEPVHPPGSPLTRGRMVVEIEMHRSGTAVDRPDALVDPLYEWVLKALVNNALGGLCHGIEEGDSTFEYPATGEYADVKLTTEMIVSFSYRAADPALKT